MLKRTLSGVMFTLLLMGMVTLAFNIQPARKEAENWVVFDDKAPSPFARCSKEYQPSTPNRPKYHLANAASNSPDLLAFYYPWYGTPDVSGYWSHWDDENHNPDNFSDGRREIAAKNYPLLDVYDSNNESLIEKHIEIAKMANIDGFVVSWWGIGSFEDNALIHIQNVSEENNFEFTIYYETTSGVGSTVNDILYLLNNYADSSSWYKIDGRPVIYIYGRALHQLYPKMWKIGGRDPHWSVFEDIREPPRDGIFVIHPEEADVGYVESYGVVLNPNETYSLKIGISDMRDDCSPHSDVGFRIRIENETKEWETLDDLIVNFNEGWLDLSYNISYYAGQTVSVRVESYAGGAIWCSEWAAVDYFYIVNSKGEIINEGAHFDNQWRKVVEMLTDSGYNPYFIVDFGGYEYKVEDFAEYFLNFTDGLHTYNPIALSMSDLSEIYNKTSNAAYSKNKLFIATVMPGYDDTEIRSPGYVVDRQNGSYYNLSWSTAKSSSPDGYIITSFNEWHEGTEIEPSLEYGYQYIDLTKTMSTTWTVDDDGPANFHTIQEAINAASNGDIIYVKAGIYSSIHIDKSLILKGENKYTTIIDGGDAILILSNNVRISNFTIQNAFQGWGSVYVDGYVNLTFSDNIMLNNHQGIRLIHTSGNVISDNVINGNSFGAIGFDWANDNIVHNNTLTNSGTLGAIHGGYPSCNNIFSENTIIGNTHGIEMNDIFNDNRFFHNNFIDNTVQVYFYGPMKSNSWENGCEGNYWSNYNGSDSDGDGIGDSPYVIDENNTDSYPLMNPYWNPGDVDHDLDVDLFDAVRLLLAYGSTPEDEHYNCHCDINEPYGAIDLFDAILLLLNYGKKYS